MPIVLAFVVLSRFAADTLTSQTCLYIGLGIATAVLVQMLVHYLSDSLQSAAGYLMLGRGIAKKLEQNGMFTMGDVALCSERNEDLLYKLFGKNAEWLIDHAWGWEPTTIEAIKAYRPSSNSLSSGQVLPVSYTHLAPGSLWFPA